MKYWGERHGIINRIPNKITRDHHSSSVRERPFHAILCANRQRAWSQVHVLPNPSIRIEYRHIFVVSRGSPCLRDLVNPTQANTQKQIGRLEQQLINNTPNGRRIWINPSSMRILSLAENVAGELQGLFLPIR
jgi:hypothetical protein